MHRLTAGAGYQYLLRHIATGDCAGHGTAPVTAYYSESGNPPGRWLGRGIEHVGATRCDPEPVGLGAGAVVNEEAMARLFSRGTDPVTGAPLGRPYPQVASPADRAAAAVRALPAGMETQARAAAVEAITRVELGRETNAVVAGFDLTFTVMKSVSTLWAVSDPRVQQSIFDAHSTAVHAALRYLENQALFTRTGHGGCRQEPTRGALAAAFDHWDSRTGDPNLHTHLVVANKVQGHDGQWRSVDSRALHHAVVTISELYEAILIDDLTRRLPVRWHWRNRGPRRALAFELDGVDDALMAEFSQRSTQIDEAMTAAVARFAAGHGRGPNRIEIIRLRQHVTRMTRPTKIVHPLADLLARWRRRATAVTGESPQQLTARVMKGSRTRPVRLEDLSTEVVDELAHYVLAGVRERRSTWTRLNVVAETLRVTKPLGTADEDARLAITDRIADEVLARCVSLEAPAVFTATGAYARPDGRSVFGRPSEVTFTDEIILRAESRLLESARATTGPTARVLEGDLAGNEAGPLASDQAAATRNIASSGRVVDLLVGPAGSGKTTTLAALRTVWEREHGRGSVIGLAPSSTAAANLAGALGIACENTAKWLHESTGPGAQQRRAVLNHLNIDRARVGRNLVRLRTIDTAAAALRAEDRRWTIAPNQLVVVDEASLAGTLALDDLTCQARQAGAKVLLVGDHAQLSAIDAGGTFEMLADRVDPAHLRTLWRFTHPWEAAATAGLRTGNLRVLGEYDEAGRIHAGPGESMLEDAYTAWSADIAAGKTAILLAPDATTVNALNQRAHHDRVLDGTVQPHGLTTNDGAEVGIGDRIVTRLNDRTLIGAGGYVRNGDLWDVRGIAPDGALQVVRARTALARRGVVGTAGSLDDHTMVLPAGYARQNVELAYATTIHRAQGITVDTAHVLAHAGMTRESLYVAMTRGRDRNEVYLAVERIDPDCDDPPDPHAPGDAREILSAILTTRGAEKSATATIAANLDDATSLRRLEPIARTLYAEASQRRWATRFDALGLDPALLVGTDQTGSFGSLPAALDRAVTLAGDVDTVLRSVILTGHPDSLGCRLSAWLRAHSDDPAALPTINDTIGLDHDGTDLLRRVEGLIRQRTDALTVGVLQERPGWLEALGPEPIDEPERGAWVTAIAAHASHLDRRHQADPPQTTTSAPIGV